MWTSRLEIEEGNEIKIEVPLNFDCHRSKKLKEECEKNIKTMRVYILII